MKKVILLIVLLITSLFFACDPGTYYFHKSEYFDKIERIELIRYNNDNYKMIDASNEDLIFEVSKVEKLEILDDDKTSDFLSDFEKIVFHYENDSVNEPIGYCLLWYLENGHFLIFSCTMIEGDRAYGMAAEFDGENNFVRHYASFAARPHFEDVLDKYFETYIKPSE